MPASPRRTLTSEFAVEWSAVAALFLVDLVWARAIEFHLLGLLPQRPQMQELWRLSFIASALCCLLAMLFPALGPFKVFNLPSEGTFLPVMEHLLSHRDLVFTPASLAGVVCFPSL